MSTPLRRAAMVLVSLLLAIGAATLIPSGSANAATTPNCAAQDRAAGASAATYNARLGGVRTANKRVAKAKRAYRHHHTKKAHAKVVRAKRAKRAAVRRAHVALARFNSTRVAAARCHATRTSAGTHTTTPAPSDPITLTANQFCSLAPADIPGLCTGGKFTPLLPIPSLGSGDLPVSPDQLCALAPGGDVPGLCTGGKFTPSAGLVQQLLDLLGLSSLPGLPGLPLPV